MKKRNLMILTMLLCFIATIGWAADLQKGTDALGKGDYKTAYKEFLPLAEQGVSQAQYDLII